MHELRCIAIWGYLHIVLVAFEIPRLEVFADLFSRLTTMSALDSTSSQIESYLLLGAIPWHFIQRILTCRMDSTEPIMSNLFHYHASLSNPRSSTALRQMWSWYHFITPEWHRILVATCIRGQSSSSIISSILEWRWYGQRGSRARRRNARWSNYTT
jgi:hypothetical protein